MHVNDHLPVYCQKFQSTPVINNWFLGFSSGLGLGFARGIIDFAVVFMSRFVVPGLRL